tara:strand:- start:1855 stop:1998 length:144 start_codon:yes stop_codon:yes gene_type:complete
MLELTREMEVEVETTLNQTQTPYKRKNVYNIISLHRVIYNKRKIIWL